MTDIPKSYRIEIAGVARDLPVCQVAPGVHIGILMLIGDPELTEAAGRELAKRMPADVDVIVMPDGKAQPLLHVVQRETGLPAVLVRKEKKSYLKEPVLETPATSITTQKKHAFFLGADDASMLIGCKVAILDDVVSSGGTIKAVQALLALAGVEETVVMAVGTEGASREDVIALTHFPVYLSK